MKKQTRILLLRIIYLYTVLGAGAFGTVMFINRGFILNIFPFLEAETIPFGTLASLWIAFGIAAVWGLLKPLEFAPILIIQLSYKGLWFFLVIIPLVMSRELPREAIIFIVLFGLYILLDLIAIPFRDLSPLKGST
jgi:hypothetical protein